MTFSLIPQWLMDWEEEAGYNKRRFEMPSYDYECPDCKNQEDKPFRFEFRQPDYKVHQIFCPKCRAISQRLMSVCNVSFGWRLTDQSLYGGLGTPKDEVERDI